MTKHIADGRSIDDVPSHGEPAPKSDLGRLLDAFEKLSPEERQRDIERANAFFREHGIDTIEKFDQWVRNDPAR